VRRLSDIISGIRQRFAGLIAAGHIRTGLTVAAVLAVGYAAADTAVNLSRTEIPKRPAPQSEARSPGNAAAAQPGTADYGIITERNYFGSSSTPAAAGDLKFKPDYNGNASNGSSLHLELLGTVAGRGGRGYAVIEERDRKKQGLFRVGDTVAGATLREVRRNAVVLRVGEKDELLEVRSAPRESLAGRGEAAAAPQRAGIGRISSIVRPSAPGQADSPALKEVRDLLAEGQAKPHFNSGRMEGFYINKVKEGSYMQKAGLEDGDIIQSINNRKIENPDDVIWIQKIINNPADRISLQVNRKGRQINIEVN
jgi:type II secretion system protein C